MSKTEGFAELQRLRRHIDLLEDQALEREVELGRARRERDALEQEVWRIHRSLSFRLGMGATAPLRWVVDRLVPRSG
jgi:hypothetical protein